MQDGSSALQAVGRGRLRMRIAPLIMLLSVASLEMGSFGASLNVLSQFVHRERDNTSTSFLVVEQEAGALINGPPVQQRFLNGSTSDPAIPTQLAQQEHGAHKATSSSRVVRQSESVSIATSTRGDRFLNESIAAPVSTTAATSVEVSTRSSKVVIHPTQDENKPTSSHVFGFFYQVFKQPKATLEMVKSVNKHMPKAPILMISSAGYHFEPLAARFPQIHYTHEDVNFDPPMGGKQDVSLKVWFDRVEGAAKWCNCSYLVLLEDDVHMTKPLVDEPENDAGGVDAVLWSGTWDKRLEKDFNISSWSYGSHGMCGGSYIRTSVFLEAYRRVDWDRIHRMHEFMTGIGHFNDVTIAVLMMDQGYVLKPWKDVTEVGKYYNESASLIHQWKFHYNVPLATGDGPVISDALNVNTTYSDKRLKWQSQRLKPKYLLGVA